MAGKPALLARTEPAFAGFRRLFRPKAIRKLQRYTTPSKLGVTGIREYGNTGNTGNTGNRGNSKNAAFGRESGRKAAYSPKVAAEAAEPGSVG